MSGHTLRGHLTALRRYVGDVMGDNHYRRYLEHHARHRPGETPMTEGEYWRDRHAATETSPQSRCC